MPAVSERQRRFMGAELARARAGDSTRTGMSVSQLEDYARKPGGKMPTERTYRGDGTMTSMHIGADKSDEDIAAAESKARLGSTAGSGLGSKGKGGADMPKQKPGQSAADFGREMREWRERQSKTPQKTALREMLGSK